MAHRILKYDMQEGTTQAWHGLTQVRENITLDDNWLRRWDIQPVTLQKKGQDTRWRILECSDVPELEIGLAYNSETFRPITNVEFLGLIRDSVAGTEHRIVSVGSVRNRGRVFCTLELMGKEKFQAAGREFNAYLNFGNGHDKSSVLWTNTSNTCTVCDNTFSMNLFAVENAQSDNPGLVIRQRHTNQAIFRFPMIASLIDKAAGVQAEFAQAMNIMAGQPLKAEAVRQLFAGHVGRDIAPALVDKGPSSRGTEKVDRLSELFVCGRGNHGENIADAVMAVTDFYTHESVRGGDKNRQFTSSEYEAGAIAKREFFTMAQDQVKMEDMINQGAALLAATTKK